MLGFAFLSANLRWLALFGFPAQVSRALPQPLPRLRSTDFQISLERKPRQYGADERGQDVMDIEDEGSALALDELPSQ